MSIPAGARVPLRNTDGEWIGDRPATEFGSGLPDVSEWPRVRWNLTAASLAANGVGKASGSTLISYPGVLLFERDNEVSSNDADAFDLIDGIPLVVEHGDYVFRTTVAVFPDSGDFDYTQRPANTVYAPNILALDLADLICAPVLRSALPVAVGEGRLRCVSTGPGLIEVVGPYVTGDGTWSLTPLDGVSGPAIVIDALKVGSLP